MKRILSFSLLVLLAVAAWGEPAKPSVGPLIQQNNAFAVELFGRCLRQKEGNVVVAPFAVSSSLALTSFGARGRTAEELNKAVHLLDQERLHQASQGLSETLARADDPRRLMRLTVRTRLRGTKGTDFTPGFLQVAQTSYGARREVKDLVDLNHLRLVKPNFNEDDLPDDLPVLPADNNAVPLALASVARLESAKESSLPSAATPMGTFTLASMQPVQLPFMRQTGLFNWAETGEMQLVDLPYPDSDLHLVILLPRKATELATLEKKLDLEALVQVVNRASPREVDLKLPRCRLLTDGSLKKPLEQLGLITLFDSAGADLPGLIDTSKRVYLADVKHVAAIDLGSCYAEPALRRLPTGADPAPVVFQADRPFLFLVRDASTGAILILGRVTDPSQQ